MYVYIYIHIYIYWGGLRRGDVEGGRREMDEEKTRRRRAKEEEEEEEEEKRAGGPPFPPLSPFSSVSPSLPPSLPCTCSVIWQRFTLAPQTQAPCPHGPGKFAKGVHKNWAQFRK